MTSEYLNNLSLSSNCMADEPTKPKYGDFAEVKEEAKPQPFKPQPYKKPKPSYHHGPQTIDPNMPIRVRMPGKGQLIGVVTQRLGGNRMSVKATDKKVRNCRVPGRFARRFWIRPNDAVMIEPWEFDDEKADIVYHYQGNELFQLKKRGILDNINNEF